MSGVVGREGELSRGLPLAVLLAVCLVLPSVAQENYASWGGTAKVRLNTTVTGANVSSNVVGFPVLVRLGVTNFDFARAKGNGADIRFTKPGGNVRLPHEIEVWDSAGEHATIWVRLDTVYGNRSDQYFEMYWNNPSAADSSSASSVFGAGGFAGVWHFGQAAGDGAAGLADATGAGLAGTPQGFQADGEATTGAQTLIGKGLDLGTANAAVTVNHSPRLTPGGVITVSAWVKADAALNGNEVFAMNRKSGGGAAYVLGIESNLPMFSWTNAGDVRKTTNGPDGLSTGKWHYVTGVRRADSLYFFVDGAKVHGPVAASGTLFSADGGLIFGAADGGGTRHFDGYLDELRVSQAGRSADWIRLSYANQQQNDSLTTVETDIIGNSVEVDRAWFDSSNNAIKVAWHFVFESDVEFGYTSGTDSAGVVGATPANWARASRANDTATIELGEEILFDTTYYVSFRLRRNPGTPSVPSRPASSAIASVKTPRFTWEAMRYFESGEDTVWAFNRHVAIWPGDRWLPGGREVLVAYTPASTPAGLVAVGMGFYTTQNDDYPEFNIGMTWESLPAWATPGDVRLYRRSSDGRWSVYHDYEYIAEHRLITIEGKFTNGDSLFLGIDTLKPVSQILSEVDSPVSPSTTLYDSVDVSDNIHNIRTYFQYERGGHALLAPTIDSLNGTSGVISTVISPEYVTADNGVRAYLIVSDSRSSDTLNLSRRVTRTHASDIATKAESWVPLRTVFELDNNRMAPVLAGVLGGPGYDVDSCRIFRWFDQTTTVDSSSGPHDWVEYDATREEVFSLKPGKLVWIKTRDVKRLEFGSGVTMSLRDTVDIRLPAKQWTDFALPFNFEMYMGDILRASSETVGQMDFYAWADQGSRYVTTPLFLARLPDAQYADSTDTLYNHSEHGYSVYNPLETAVTLRIPPMTCAVSRLASGGGKRVAMKRAAGREWALRVEAWTSQQSSLGTVVLGYKDGSGEPATWFAAPPTFANVSVRAYDRQANSVHGHVVYHENPQDGLTFELAFDNSSSEAKQIHFRLAGVENLSDGSQVVLVDPSAGAVAPGDAEHSVTVPAKGRVYRSVVVGDCSASLARVRPFAYCLVYPNPARAAVAIRFVVPASIGRVEAEAFDAAGRLVWRKQKNTGLAPGINTMVWEPSVTQGGATAGTYVVRFRAFDRAGKQIASVERRVVRIP